MSAAPPSFSWRGIALVTFVPTTLFALGQFAVLPVLPALARAAGADLGTAALSASLLVVGVLLGDLPSGAIVARVGERAAMLGAAVLGVAGGLLAFAVPHPAAIGGGMLLLGVGAAAFGLARHAFLTTVVPPRMRARALSTLAGSYRLGALIGPFAGAGLLTATGSTPSVLVLLVACCAAIALLLLLLPDPERATRRANPPEASRLFGEVRRSGRVLATVGVGAALLAGLRQARQVAVPVWAASIGLDETATSLIVGVAGALDFSLFFLGGWVMDRVGRLWAILPCALGLSIAFFVLAPTHDLDTRVGWFIGATLGLALANGVGSGVLLTLGSDLANPRNPAAFLAAWRFTTDSGAAALPLVFTAITAAVSLSAGVATLGVLGVACAGMLGWFVPRTVASRPGREPVLDES